MDGRVDAVWKTSAASRSRVTTNPSPPHLPNHPPKNVAHQTAEGVFYGHPSLWYQISHYLRNGTTAETTSKRTELSPPPPPSPLFPHPILLPLPPPPPPPPAPSPSLSARRNQTVIPSTHHDMNHVTRKNTRTKPEKRNAPKKHVFSSSFGNTVEFRA